MSIAGSRDQLLEEEYDKLCGESSPYENLIGKDIGRSFPNVEMFKDPSGEGQQMLGRVLKCFSLYDQKIGYCQGLGFVVGPLLMHMGDKEAFCVLVQFVTPAASLFPANLHQSHGALRSSIMLSARLIRFTPSHISVSKTSQTASTDIDNPS